MKLMDLTERLVWMVRRDDGKYLCSTSRLENRVGSVRQAHVWKQKAWAVVLAQVWTKSAKGLYTYRAIPFALVEVDPDSIPLHAPKPVRSSDELDRLLESKI